MYQESQVILVLVPKFLLWEMTASHELSLERREWRATYLQIQSRSCSVVPPNLQIVDDPGHRNHARLLHVSTFNRMLSATARGRAP